MKFKKHIYLLCVLYFCTHSTLWATNINNIRLGNKKSFTRIVFDLNEKPKNYNVKYLSSPERIIVDFAKGKIKSNAIKNTTAYPLINKIKRTNISNNRFAIELELSHSANFKHFILSPSNGFGYRLVIDVMLSQGEKNKSTNKTEIIYPDVPEKKIRTTHYKKKSIEIYNNQPLTDATIDRLFQPLLGNTQLRETYNLNSVFEKKSSVRKDGNDLLIKKEIDNSPKFNIRGYKIKGNTLLSIRELKNIINPHTGEKKNFSDVQHALEALELNYQKLGFGMVQVYLPEQELDKGIIELNVIEPTINSLTIQGAKYFDLENVQESIVSLKKGTTPNTLLISKNLTLINENPAKKISIQFIAADKEGELNTIINIKDKKSSSYSLLLDNTGTESSGNYRLGFSYQHANLTNNDDVFNFQYTTSEKSNTLNAYSLGYHLPFYTINSSLDVFAGQSKINSGIIQNIVKISGQGLVFGLRFNQILSKRGSYTHRIIYGYDYRQYDTDAVYLSGSGPSYPDVTVQPISITYTGQWTSAGKATGFNFQAYKNIFASESDSAIFNSSRTGAKPKYIIFRFGIEHAQAFAKTWQLRTALTGQQTSNALISGEQFGIGGASSVRGYNERDVANDKGIQATAEIYSPNISHLFSFKGDVRGLIFYDYAQLSRNLPQITDPALPASLSSFGIGIRLNYKEKLTFKMDVASAQKDSNSQNKGDTKVHASLKYVF